MKLSFVINTASHHHKKCVTIKLKEIPVLSTIESFELPHSLVFQTKTDVTLNTRLLLSILLQSVVITYVSIIEVPFT